MASSISVEQLEALAAQLPPTERLKLIVHICQQLSVAMPVEAPAASPEERAEQERLAKIEAWLAECDKVAELWEGGFDSAIEA